MLWRPPHALSSVSPYWVLVLARRILLSSCNLRRHLRLHKLNVMSPEPFQAELIWRASDGARHCAAGRSGSPRRVLPAARHPPPHN